MATSTSKTITGNTTVTVTTSALKRVGGGKIFSVSSASNGATYTFYDSNGNVMSNVGVGSSPYYYSVSGTPTSKKYYVYYPTISSGTYSWNNVSQYSSSLNSSSANGCSDWFIPSKDVMETLRTSGLVNWFSSYYLWSSSEYDSYAAWIWYYNIGNWRSNYKGLNGQVVAVRAF